MGKQVIKISAEEFITSKYHYDEIATLNVTRGERIAMDSGSWKTTNFRAAKWIREFQIASSKKNSESNHAEITFGLPIRLIRAEGARYNTTIVQIVQIENVVLRN